MFFDYHNILFPEFVVNACKPASIGFRVGHFVFEYFLKIKYYTIGYLSVALDGRNSWKSVCETAADERSQTNGQRVHLQYIDYTITKVLGTVLPLFVTNMNENDRKPDHLLTAFVWGRFRNLHFYRIPKAESQPEYPLLSVPGYCSYHYTFHFFVRVNTFNIVYIIATY